MNDLPRGRAVVPHRVGVAGKAQVDKLAGDVLPLQLFPHFSHNVPARLYAGVKRLPVPVEDLRSKAVIATVGASGVDVHGVVAVLRRRALRFIDRAC